ncbi:MAG: hypothetical protein FJ403_01430 [Verrucomicrobia bacterium]|nr:hypothetical protein [Verrucomicrobiota bacterium]
MRKRASIIAKSIISKRLRRCSLRTILLGLSALAVGAASYPKNGARLTNFDFSFLYPASTAAWEESWDAVIDARDPKNEKIIVPGIIFNSPPRSYVLKYNTDLTLDQKFGPEGKGYCLISWTDVDSPGNGFTIKGMAVREDGRILLAGPAPQKNSPGGRVSFDFNSAADLATALAYDPKRKAIRVAGITRGDRGRGAQPIGLIAKLTADGMLDTGFNGTGKLSIPGGAAADIMVDAAGNAIF